MIKCKVCGERCFYSYFFVNGDYMCEFCHAHEFDDNEWNDLYEDDPDNYYWSSINEDDYKSILEQDKADFINELISEEQLFRGE